MAQGRSSKVVALSLAASALSAAACLWAAAATGASALVALGLLFLAAAGSQALILIGLRRQRRPGDKATPATDLYVWTYVAALLLFALCAGVAINAGVTKLAAPPRILLDTAAGYTAIAVSLLLVATALAGIVLRGNEPATEDRATAAAACPPLHTTLIETAAALTGLLVAAVGFALAHAWGSPITDGNAAILIGLLIGTVAAAMVIEIRRVLIAAPISRAARLSASVSGLIWDDELNAPPAASPENVRQPEARVSRSAQKRLEREQRRKPH